MSKISLKKGETIHATLHQSALVYTKQWLLVLVLYTATSYFLFWLLEQGTIGQVAIALGYTLGTYILLRTIIFLKGNHFIVTNSRVIDVYKPKIFSSVVRQIKMSDISDVTGETHGIFDTITRLGALAVEGDDMRVVFRHARGVHVLQDAILELKQTQKKSHLEDDEVPSLSSKQMLAHMEDMTTEKLSQLIESAMKILKHKKEQ